MVERRSPVLDDTYGALSHAVRRRAPRLAPERPVHGSRIWPSRSTSRWRPSRSTSASSRTPVSSLERRWAGPGSSPSSPARSSTRAPGSTRTGRSGRSGWTRSGPPPPGAAHVTGTTSRSASSGCSAPVEDVFDAMTEPARMADWFSPIGRAEVEADPVVGGRRPLMVDNGDVRIEHDGEFLDVHGRPGSRSPGGPASLAPGDRRHRRAQRRRREDAADSGARRPAPGCARVARGRLGGILDRLSTVATSQEGS